MIASATTLACPSANTPAFGVPTLVTSPTAYTPGKRVSSVSGSTGIQPSTRHAGRPRRPRARGAPARRGTGRRASRRRRRARATLRVGIERARRSRSGTNSMPRSANAARSASDASGDGGIGAAERHHDRDRRRRRAGRARAGSRAASSAVSLGAGGHLNGAPHTPTITAPAVNAASTSRSAGARDRVELVAALDQARASRDVEVGAERDDQDVGLEARRRPSRPAAGWDRSTGSVSCTNRTPRLHEVAVRVQPDGVGRLRRTSRRASRSRTRSASAWSISTTSTSSPSSSDSRVVSSSPPKPAPRTSTDVVMAQDRWSRPWRDGGISRVDCPR